jgi:hypothetical protein
MPLSASLSKLSICGLSVVADSHKLLPSRSSEDDHQIKMFERVSRQVTSTQRLIRMPSISGQHLVRSNSGQFVMIYFVTVPYK